MRSPSPCSASLESNWSLSCPHVMPSLHQVPSQFIARGFRQIVAIETKHPSQDHLEQQSWES